MGDSTEPCSPGPCTVGAGTLHSLPNSRGCHSHRLQHEWSGSLDVHCCSFRGLEFPPVDTGTGVGWEREPLPTRTPTVLTHAPVVTSPRRLLNSAPRLCLSIALQFWVRSSLVTGSSPTEAREGKPGPHPGNTACSL